VRVAGTQAYQDAVLRVVGPPTEGPGSRASWRGEAELVPEPGNHHDANAVRVVVEGVTVGYLPREVADWLRWELIALERRGERLRVPC
jgi:hypothetical protein